MYPEETLDIISTFIVDTACFVSDVTIGTEYLPSQELQKRTDTFWTSFNSLSPKKLASLLSAEQVVDFVSQILADAAFWGGIGKVATFVKEIDSASKIKSQASKVAQTFKKAVDTHLADNPILLTVESVSIQIPSKMKPEIQKFSKNVDNVGKYLNSCTENIIEKTVPNRMLIRVEEQLVEKVANNGVSKAPQCLNSKASFNKSVIIEESKLEFIESQKFLENFSKEFFKESKTEIEVLKEMFNQYYKINGKWLKIDFEHFFGMDVSWSKKGKLHLGGFHHDFDNKVLKTNVFEFRDKVVYDYGFWKAKMFYKGNFVKNTSFFPPDWSREKVTSKIFEAYNNAIKSGVELTLNNEGKYYVIGFIKEGIEIEMYITQKGYIKTAYPIFK